MGTNEVEADVLHSSAKFIRIEIVPPEGGCDQTVRVEAADVSTQLF